MKAIAGIFLILHGLVHMWYVTLSQGWVEFQPDMGWTGRSWLLSSFLGEGATRLIAGVIYALAALAFVVSGVGVLANADWFRPLLLGSAVFSGVIVLVFWDGSMEMIVQKGLLGLLINIGILVYMLLVS
jgi:hypothetical protein